MLVLDVARPLLVPFAVHADSVATVKRRQFLALARRVHWVIRTEHVGVRPCCFILKLSAAHVSAARMPAGRVL